MNYFDVGKMAGGFEAPVSASAAASSTSPVDGLDVAVAPKWPPPNHQQAAHQAQQQQLANGDYFAAAQAQAQAQAQAAALMGMANGLAHPHQMGANPQAVAAAAAFHHAMQQQQQQQGHHHMMNHHMAQQHQFMAAQQGMFAPAAGPPTGQYPMQPQQQQHGGAKANGYNHVAPDADWSQQAVSNESMERHLFGAPKSGINFDKYENIPVEVSGKDVPPAIENFSDADLHAWILENITRAGYSKPTPVQKNSLPALLGHRDVMSCAQTGSGKTAAFLLPIIHQILTQGLGSLTQPSLNSLGRRTFYPAALVLSPTRELAMQIHKEAVKFSYRTNIITAILYGGRENYRDQINRLRAGVHILIATPGRLIDMVEQAHVSLSSVKFLVLDEADRMLDMGFEPQIRKIVASSMPPKTERTTAMFSATFPKEIQVLAQDFLREDYVFLAVGRVGSTSENIEQRFELVDEMEKRRALCRILEMSPANSLVLVFVETKRGANDLSWFLQRQNVRAVAIHGDLKQFERERNLEMFRTGQNNVLVATAVAARGLDIPNVLHVVNFDLPNDVDEYVHRIGRTGRCGNTGVATSFFNDKNRSLARDLQTLLSEAHQEVPDFIIRAASEYSGGGARGRSGGRFGGTDYRRGMGGSRGGGGGGLQHHQRNSGFGQMMTGGMPPQQQQTQGSFASRFVAPGMGGFSSSIRGGGHHHTGNGSSASPSLYHQQNGYAGFGGGGQTYQPQPQQHHHQQQQQQGQQQPQQQQQGQQQPQQQQQVGTYRGSFGAGGPPRGFPQQQPPPFGEQQFGGGFGGQRGMPTQTAAAQQSFGMWGQN